MSTKHTSLLVGLLFILFSNIVKCSNYILNYSYVGDTFFDDFNFDHYRQGDTFSNFQNYSSALSMGLINTTSTTAYIGTDYTNIVGSEGRASIEMSSHHNWEQGLFILNVSHMPQGCGTWPAWWFLGTYAPTNGEIDVIEGIDMWTYDQSSLHTDYNNNGLESCDYKSVANNLNMSGIWVNYNCTLGASGGGCTIKPNNTLSFGEPFNNNGGGIYVMELNDNIGIKTWFWSMSKPNDIPQDIYNKKPNPDTWKIPYGYWPFSTKTCTANHFNNMQILFDLYYCGWSGESYFWDQKCQSITNNVTCQEWVAKNPSYFRDAYWLINYLDVYQMQ